MKDFFRTAGDITYANVDTPRQGSGVVEFADRKGLEIRDVSQVGDDTRITATIKD